MDTPLQTATLPDPLIVLFDNSCGFCDRAVRFILNRDPHRRFRFAALQSPIANELMLKHQLDPEHLDSIVVIDGDKAYTKSTAVLRIALELPDPWPLAGVLVFIPAVYRDTLYDYIARHRKLWFKPPNTCETPTKEQQDQFLK